MTIVEQIQIEQKKSLNNINYQWLFFSYIIYFSKPVVWINNKLPMSESNQYRESPSTSKVGPAPLKKKITLVSKICAKARVEPYPDDFYAKENILFCKFCLHSVDIFRVDTIKDHIKSKTHLTKKSSKKSSQLKQKTITILLKCEEVWNDFGLDFYLIFLYTKLKKWGHFY